MARPKKKKKKNQLCSIFINLTCRISIKFWGGGRLHLLKNKIVFKSLKATEELRQGSVFLVLIDTHIPIDNAVS